MEAGREEYAAAMSACQENAGKPLYPILCGPDLKFSSVSPCWWVLLHGAGANLWSLCGPGWRPLRLRSDDVPGLTFL